MLSCSNDPRYVFDLLVHLGILEDQDDLDTLTGSLPIKFTPDEEKEAMRVIHDPPNDVDKRYRASHKITLTYHSFLCSTDFRDLVAVAVDPEDTLERDDAFSVAEKDGEQWVLIHIADASR